MNRRFFPVILLFVLFVTAPSAAQDEIGDLLGRINALRASIGRASYALSGALNAAAQDQAQWIANTGSVSHTRPDGSNPRGRALGAGYPTADVSENIYGGANATANDAWTFWVNSDIHYRGLVNERYREIGIGIGRSSWGTAYVLVFGNPGGAPPLRASSGSSAGEANAASGPPPQPDYVVGLDANGNIMHEVQPGDTLGDILLIYGYTWEVLPYVLQINNIVDVRDLEIGSILLVPPQAGTYTPTPFEGTQSPDLTATPEYPTPFPEEPFATAVTTILVASATNTTAMPDLTNTPVATISSPVNETPLQVAAVPTTTPILTTTAETGSSWPSWLVVGLAVQVLVLLAAVIEFIRRAGRR